MLGFVSAVIARVQAAEQDATTRATSPAAAEGGRMTLVLADRRQVIMRNIEHAYPVTRARPCR